MGKSQCTKGGLYLYSICQGDNRALEEYEITCPRSTKRGVAKLHMQSTSLRFSPLFNSPTQPSILEGNIFPSALNPAKVHFEVR